LWWFSCWDIILCCRRSFLDTRCLSGVVAWCSYRPITFFFQLYHQVPNKNHNPNKICFFLSHPRYENPGFIFSLGKRRGFFEWHCLPYTPEDSNLGKWKRKWKCCMCLSPPTLYHAWPMEASSSLSFTVITYSVKVEKVKGSYGSMFRFSKSDFATWIWDNL